MTQIELALWMIYGSQAMLGLFLTWMVWDGLVRDALPKKKRRSKRTAKVIVLESLKNAA